MKSRSTKVRLGSEGHDGRLLQAQPEPARDVGVLTRRILEQHPDPAAVPPRDYNFNNRTAPHRVSQTP